MTTTPIISPIADLQRQLDLLQMEYEYEKETYRQQSERIYTEKYNRDFAGILSFPVKAITIR